MNGPLADDDVREALDGCASEPVHIPGTIQPFGFVLASEITTGIVRYASKNVATLFGRDLGTIFGHHLRDLLGVDIWHAVTNFVASHDFARRRHFAGIWQHADTDYAVHVTQGGDCIVFEIEGAAEMPMVTPEMLREQTFLVDQIQHCTDEDILFHLTTRLLRHVTGFDRVMIYRFDSEWNGEVLAEARRGSLPSFDGLRFPHWDIPAQARAIMARIQVRLISDIDQVPVEVVAEDPGLPPLDLSLAHVRGVSAVHLQYLRNMGTGATMTLSVVLDDKLWGMISFHHKRPKVAPADIRQMLTSGVLPVFCLKLGTLRNQATLAISHRLDQLQANIQRDLEQETSIADMLDHAGPAICATMDVAGLAVMSGAETNTHGLTPPQPVLDALTERARATHQAAGPPIPWPTRCRRWPATWATWPARWSSRIRTVAVCSSSAGRSGRTSHGRAARPRPSRASTATSACNHAAVSRPIWKRCRAGVPPGATMTSTSRRNSGRCSARWSGKRSCARSAGSRS